MQRNIAIAIATAAFACPSMAFDLEKCHELHMAREKIEDGRFELNKTLAATYYRWAYKSCKHTIDDGREDSWKLCVKDLEDKPQTSRYDNSITRNNEYSANKSEVIRLKMESAGCFLKD